MSATIRVDGLDELVRGLKRFSPELAAELKSANRSIAESVVPVAKGKAPVRSGRLAASVRAGATAKTGVVRAGSARVPYVGVIHFGSPKRGIAPRPFLYDALDDRRAEIIAEYERRVAKLVERI